MIGLNCLIAAPAGNEREVAPVEIGAPAAAPSEVVDPQLDAAPTPTPPESSPAAAPAAASDPTLYWRTGPGVGPAPMVVPPPVAPSRPVRPDRPIQWRVDILGAIGTVVFRDPADRAFDRDRSALQYGLTVRGDTRLGKGRVFLGGGATYRRFDASGAPYDSFSTRLRVREPIGFVRLSVMTVEGLDVFAQAGGGVSIVDVNFNSSMAAAQRSIAPVVDGMAGLTMYLLKRWLARRGASRMTGGLELGAGYTWRGDVTVRPRLDTPEDPIDTTSASFGDVALRGFAWRFGVFIRFQ
jgi:hypothetical protein